MRVGMKRKGMVRMAAFGLVGVLGLTSCTGAKSALPDLSSLGKVTAISREEGSGTRAEFETLVDTTEDGAAAVATSTQEVQDMVAADTNAIGYLAFSGMEGSRDVKLLRVDRKEVTAENIRKGKYPLCRSYYLAYRGELNALAQDFMAYVMSRGQGVVGQSCVSVKKASTFLSEKPKGTLLIKGSTSAAALIEELAKDYETCNPGAKITMEPSDSSQGLTAAIRGECDLAVSSRDLKDYENELLTKKAFARDGIAVVVNADNPVDELSVKQIKTLYDGDCENWKDLK